MKLLRRPEALYIIFVILPLLTTGKVEAKTLFVSELHVSALSDAPNRSVLASTYGWGIRGGYQWKRWVALGHIEQNQWLSTELNDRTTAGTLNMAVGGGYFFKNNFVRSSALLGTSTLLFDTIFHNSGKTGFFLDLRPLELSWQINRFLGINLSPLSFTYVSPALSEPSIRMVLYRTNVGVELRL